MTTTAVTRDAPAPFAAKVAAVAALPPPDRLDVLNDAVIDFGVSYVHERRWGYKPEFMRLPALPEMTHAEHLEMQARVHDRYWSALIDKVELRACSAAIDAAWQATRPKKSRLSGHILRGYLRDRDGDDCWLCHEPMGDDCTIEHKRAKAMGGTSNLANLALAHRECNRVVGHAGIAVKEAIRAANDSAMSGERGR